MKKKSTRQILIAVIACILAALMLVPMILTVVTSLSAGAANSYQIRNEITALKDKNKRLANEQATLNAQLKTIQANKSAALSKKENLERQIAVIQETIANLTEEIAQYEQLIAEKEREVAEKEEQAYTRFERFKRQVRLMEKEGTVSYWTILFSADSFTDLLDRINLVNDIAEYNEKVCVELEAARNSLLEAQAELEEALAETEEVKAEQEEHRAQLSNQETQVKSLIKEIAGNEALTKQALDELAAAADAADAEIAKKEKELEAAIAAERAKNSNKYQFDPGSGWYWPLPAERVSVTSFFGPRSDPFTGAYSNHTGTDIGAYSGTEIYAAHGGIVLTSVYNGSYGNYVVLSRGDGITTLYAHMSRRAVEVGQVVQQGQVIGYVGSTGRSTAPHLHYEVRENGVRKDALKYYPNIQWKNNTGFPYS